MPTYKYSNRGRKSREIKGKSTSYILIYLNKNIQMLTVKILKTLPTYEYSNRSRKSREIKGKSTSYIDLFEQKYTNVII